MTVRLDAASLDLAAIVRPGDAIVWGQACGEPATLTEALVAQRAVLGGVSAFVGSAFSDTLRPEHVDHIAVSSMGAIGTLGRLSAAGALAIVPCHVGQVATYIEQGLIGCDVAFVQVAPAGADGAHSYGLVHDYIEAAVAKARIVVAEVNDRIPRTIGDAVLEPSAIDYLVEASRPPLEVPAATIGDIERRIAACAGAYIGDRSVLQMGIGAVPEAITASLGDRRELGVHSGMIGDGIADLIERGVVIGATTGALIGTERLYRLADGNSLIRMRNTEATHGDTCLAGIARLVSINSAIEVDLTGQVNAEQSGARYLGATGGQVDYVRGGARSPGGRAIVALPSTAKGGTVSRIVAALSGPVTTARSEVDVIVTEHGAAELKGRSLTDRARAMIAIADPAFREALDRAAHDLFQRGY